MYETYQLSKDFIWRRLHSLTGLFITLYLIEHLLVNSRAAFLFGENGEGFVRAVNDIHDLPYLPLIEIFLLGVPILIHMYWGIVYLQTAHQNYYETREFKPILNENKRNRAYTWQRITSWILLVGIIAHVIHMRFLEYPQSAQVGDKKYYTLQLEKDPGLYTLSARLGFQIYDKEKINLLKSEKINQEFSHPSVLKQAQEEQNRWIQVLESYSLNENEVVGVNTSFGMAELLLVRETFKIPLMIALYTIFVLTACYHGFNGLWTFMIKWGITLTERSQLMMRRISIALMVIVATWGLSSIWITYWINLKN